MPNASNSPAEQIASFRTALGLSQDEFASILDVTRVAVLRWEKRKGGTKPSAEAYIHLAKLAHKRARLDAALWFWQQAKIDIDILRQLVPEIDKSLRRHEKRALEARSTAESVEVPLLSSSVFQGSAEEVFGRIQGLESTSFAEADVSIKFPVSSIPRLSTTGAVLAPDNFMGPFREGDVVAVDFSHKVFPPVGSEELAEWFSLSYRNRESPIYAAYCGSKQAGSWGVREGLHLRRLWLSGIGLGNLHLETDFGKGGYFGDSDAKSPPVVIHGEHEWAILGRVVSWIGTAPGEQKKRKQKKQE